MGSSNPSRGIDMLKYTIAISAVDGSNRSLTDFFASDPRQPGSRAVTASSWSPTAADPTEAYV